MKTITVKAAPGVKVPKEGAPRHYIEDAPQDVPASAYYLRRLDDGDLIPVEPSQAKTPARSGDKE